MTKPPCGGFRNSICFLGYPFACRSLSRNRPLDGSKKGLTSVAGTLLNLVVLGIVLVMAVRWSPALRTAAHDIIHNDLCDHGGVQ